MRPARFFFGLLFGAMLFFAFIRLLFAAVLFLGIAALGMIAFRAMRRWSGRHAWQNAGQESRDGTASAFAPPAESQIIVLGQPLRRPVTLAMRQRTIEVR